VILTGQVSCDNSYGMVDVAKNVTCLFDELLTQGETIKAACKKLYFSGVKKAIDAQGFEAWRTSCLTLLRSTFGTSSPHYDSFINLKFFDYYNSTLLYLGILQAAREDILKGYFYHKDLMLSVNVFNAFLLHALHFADEGEYEKAAGILESVVSEALRKLAESRGLASEIPSGIPEAAEALFRAGALKEEPRDGIRKLSDIVHARSVFGRDRKCFSRWHDWVHRFVYEHLGSRIVIVN
jgi:hypothetical protein